MPTTGPSVLLVTDAVWVENDVRASLTDRGTVINRVADPNLVVEAALQHSSEVAVIDLQVGSMGGMAVVRALKAAADNGEIGSLHTVLLLDREADLFIAHRAGADAAVVKPFTGQELRAAALSTAVAAPLH